MMHLASAAKASPLLHKQRLHRVCKRHLSVTAPAFNFLKAFMGIGSSTKASNSKGPNDGILQWARQATMGTQLAPTTAAEGKQLATFAGGCFWGLELQFQRVPGVEITSVGYTQGTVPNPSYEAVCSGMTGHTEAVQVTYNPSEVTFEQLLEAWVEKTDITTLNRQGNDRGTQYRSGVYYHTPEQKSVAEKFFEQMRAEIAAGKRKWAGKDIAAELKPAGDYYLAEDYHQQYLAKGGRFGRPQSTAKGSKDTIRCYG